MSRTVGVCIGGALGASEALRVCVDVQRLNI